MKKTLSLLIAFIIGIVGMASQAVAFGTPIATSNTLTFENVTSTSVTVRLNPYNDSTYANMVAQRQTIYLQYRPYGCSDNPSSQVCPAIAVIPTETSFSYDVNGSLISTLTISGLQPGTQYLFFLGRFNGIYCFTAPCPSVTYDTNAYSVTTPSFSSSNSLLQGTAVLFTKISDTSAEAILTPGYNLAQQINNFEQPSLTLQYRPQNSLETSYAEATFPIIKELFSFLIL